MQQIKQFNNNVMIYPIYQEQPVCQDIIDTLGYDITQDIDKNFSQITQIHTFGKYPFSYILFVGLGKQNEITTDKLRKIATTVSKDIKQPVQLVVNHLDNQSTLVRVWVESHILAQYEERKIGHDEKPIMNMDVLASVDVQDEINEATIYGEGINYARRLADTPSNLMTPDEMVKESIQLAKDYGMECTILDKAHLEDMKAGGILSVNQGSDIPAYMIVLKHNGDGDNAYKAVIGKGLTFDSGGYNLKGNSYGMKYDMCGGADVLGVMQILARSQAKTNVYGIVPVTENLVSGKAYKPQDVITTLSGKTVEITTTDAEGRLVLCDAMTYAKQLGVQAIIDLGTLTGPALGDVYTAVFSNDDDYFHEFEEAMKAADEKGWRLPLDQEYFDKLKSNSADMTNCSMTFGGDASVAANFLEAFVEKDIQWIHLDIASTAKKPNIGATGVMVRSIAVFLE
ncbi:MAG: leucyl aminopeptidase family protein [Massilimicrobiota timonensis]